MSLKFFNNDSAIFNRDLELVLITEGEVIDKPLRHINHSLALGSKMKTSSSAFLSHSYEITRNNLNLYHLLRNHKIYKENSPTLSYESYGKRCSMIDKTTVQKDSHASGIYVRLPKRIKEFIGWKAGDVLIIQSDGKKVILETEAHDDIR